MVVLTRKNSQAKTAGRSTYLWIKSLLTVTMTQSYEMEKQSDPTKQNGSSGLDNTQESESATSMGSAEKASRRPQQRQQRRKPSLSHDQQALMTYVPKYLKPYIYPYHGEYCYTPIFQTRFIAQVMAEGFLPVATQGMLLPKLHTERCVIRLPNELHVSKSARKKSKKYSITVNQRFQETIDGCQEQHGRNCWLYPPLVAAFREMMKAGKIEASVMDDHTGKPIPGRCWTVRLYTIEVWNLETGALAAGELGYTVGAIYTSLTGYTKEDSAGSVQMAALGRMLIELGFEMWDLGKPCSCPTTGLKNDFLLTRYLLQVWTCHTREELVRF